jgi:tetratricopeptide (TPR) repeat protein
MRTTASMLRSPRGTAGARRRRRALVVICLVLCVPHAEAESPAPTPTPCQGDSQPQSVRDARVVLERSPDELQPRLLLADALLDQGCNQDAATVLEAGQAMHPRSGELQDKLRIVRSMLTEQVYIEGIDKAQESAKLQRNLLRCTQLADISACDDALKSRPDDLQLILAKGDALLQANHPAEAMVVYRHASTLSPNNEAVKGKLAAAMAQRQSFLMRCQTGNGVSAIQACDAALLRGAQDEFAIDRRKGIVFQSMNQPGPALDSYIAANVLKQDDESVALAIVALTDSTGRKDAVALAARGTALLTLGRAPEASASLRQANALSPAIPGAASRPESSRAAARPKARHPEPVTAVAASATAKTVPHPALSIPTVEDDVPPAARTYSNEEPPDHTN